MCIWKVCILENILILKIITPTKENYYQLHEPKKYKENA